MNTEDRRERLDQANVRIEKMIWLPGSTAAMSIPEDLKDAIVDDLYQGDNAQVLSKIPTLSDILNSEDEPDPEWIMEVLTPIDGFLVQMARPVPTGFYGDGNGHSFSWGYYQTKWVHADDMGDLVALAETFSADVLQKARAKQVQA